MSQAKWFPLPRHDRTRSIRIDLHKCSGCGQCVAKCPKKVLGQVRAGRHHHVHVDEPQRCIGCLCCVNACQNGAIMNVSWWEGSQRFQRLLMNQVHARLVYFNRIDPEWSGLDCLDLGCGCGFMSEALSRLGARVTGIDPSRASLEAAREHCRTQHLDIDYLHGVGESIPMPDNSVDRVVCVDVLEHVQDVARVVSEVRRVLRPGGIFFFDTINRTGLAHFMIVTLSEGLGIIPKGTHDSKRFIRPEELRRWLVEAGFTRVSDPVGMGVDRLNRRLDFEFGLMEGTKVMYLGHAR